ncbi:MAG: hypothetical protein IPK19_29580 [Chloroflexi bacterium]|nr:hypothetical protein [Chloroflexota bacterium]
MRRAQWYAHFVLIFVGLVSAYMFARVLYPVCLDDCYARHREVIEGTAPSPYRYRILSPILVEAMARTIPQDPAIGNAVAYTLAHALVLPIMFVLVYRWLKTQAEDQSALFGTLLLAPYLFVGYQNYGTSLYTMVEIALFCGVLWWMKRSEPPFIIFVALVILATLNRETGFLLVAAYAALKFPESASRRKPYLVRLVVAGLAWLVTYGLLRVILGDAVHPWTPDQLMEGNLGYWLVHALLHNGLLLPVFVGGLLGLKSATREQKLLLLAMLPYVVLMILFSIWHEVRLWFVLFPVIMPIILRWQEKIRETPSASSGVLQ